VSRTVGFAYPGARIQACYGRLVSQAAWGRLRRLDTLSGFLQAARDTALRPWLTQLDVTAEPHQIEAQLRALFRRRVGEVSEWSPPAWRPAVAWVAVLPDLPAMTARVRGVEAPWLPADSGPGRMGAGAARASAELRGLQDAFRAGQLPAQAWLARWRALWPATRAAERRGLERLVALLDPAARGAGADAATAQAALQRPLRDLFRRDTRRPAGLFAWLALSWIEFATLRGALLRRRLALPLEGGLA